MPDSENNPDPILLANIEREVLGKYTDTFHIDVISKLAASVDSGNYATEHMLKTERFIHKFALFESMLQRVTLDGLYLEFGVFAGVTINKIAQLCPDKTIYGFDSFSGLPEDWGNTPKGTFGIPQPPPVEKNVELVIGWFDAKLPSFCHSIGDKPAAFIHIDCDIYSSTQTILSQLKPRIIPGTIIVFDEYFNYPGWRQHEWKAFQEFIEHTGHAYRYIGLVPVHTQVSVIITS